LITTGTGDLLEADVEALVNTVNCAGVMGKGIALQFKRRYPADFTAYAAACARGEVQLGRMFVFSLDAITGPRYVINFPTKGHWRDRSRIRDIETGLRDLVQVIRDRGIRSIAIPALGAGLGRLDWADVEPLIRASLEPLDDVTVHLYAPSKQHRDPASSP
jgi:O-acetyl-ADP-ribose deacetylase (regulator of RNase III)